MTPASPFSGTVSGSFLTRLHEWRMRRANVEFAVLGMIATALAFYAAIVLNLKAPSTAAVTVWVVANTKPGHVLSKSVYRVLGTLLGAAASIAIVATLNSEPVLLFTAMALWIAFCTGIGNLFRHFRAYFGLLAGYTAAFIVLGAYKHPDQVLDVALDRTSAIVIGVLSTSLVASLLGVKRSAVDMEQALRKIHRQCLDAMRERWGMSPEQLSASRLALSRSYVETEALLEYANLESPGFHLRTHDLRVLTGLLLDVMDASRLAAHQLDRAMASPEQRKEVRAIFTEIGEALEPATIQQDELSLAAARTGLEQVSVIVASSAENAVALQDREMLYPILHLLKKWTPLLEPSALARQPLRDPLLPDFRGAFRHVLRTFLGLMTAIAFWNLTSWQDGPAFLINGAAFCALSSTMSHPARALLMFAKGTTVSVVAGFLCKFLLLPYATGYWSMMACLAIVLVPIGCCAFSRRPQLDIIGMTSGLFLLALVQPSNHMTYDPGQFLSSGIAAVFGGFFLFVVFSLILPTCPEKEAASSLKTFTRSVRRLVDWPLAASFHTWRQAAHRQLRTLYIKAIVSPAQLDEGLRLLDYGSGLLRFRQLGAMLPESRKSEIATVLLAARSELKHPGKAVSTLSEAMIDFRQSDELEPVLRFTLAAHLAEFLTLLRSPSFPSKS